MVMGWQDDAAWSQMDKLAVIFTSQSIDMCQIPFSPLFSLGPLLNSIQHLYVISLIKLLWCLRD